jgi:hypothetical protein
MSSMEASRRDFSGMSHAHHLEVPGVLHLVELRVRSGQTGLKEFHSRLLAIAALHGSIFKCGMQLWGYNILSDRVLLVVIPARPHAISVSLINADRCLVRPFNEARHRVLPFWERGYSVCPLADEVAWRVLRYVDLASVPDGGDPLDPHALSSAAEHAGLVKHGLLTAPPERLPGPMAWRAFLFSHEDEQFAQALDLCLRTGKPFGPLSFVRKVEETCGRRVGSSCLKWPRLFDGCGQMPNPCKVPPLFANAESLLTQ